MFLLSTAALSSFILPPSSFHLLPEALAVFGRGDEGFDHLGGDEVAVEVVELLEPEVVALEVQVRLRRRVRVATQVAEVLHEDERAVLLAPCELVVLDDLTQRRGAAL